MEGAGEKAEQLRALALPEGSAFVPSTHVRQFTTSSRGLDAGTPPSLWHTYIHIYTHIHIHNKSLKEDGETCPKIDY